MADARGIDADRFDRWRPELGHLRSLDLNWAHGLNEEGRNFGRAFLYSIGDTGHRYVCACVIPGVAPEDYPIAVVDEEGYDVDVIAGSVRTWLPAFVARRAGELVHTAVAQNRHGEPIDGFVRDRDAFLADADGIRAALEPFAGPDVPFDVLDTAVELLRRPSTLTEDWRPAGYPGYNKPLFQAARDPQWAAEVLRRRTHIDALGSQAWKIPGDAARLLAASGGPAEAPLEPLVGVLAGKGFGSWVWGEAYYAAARRWLDAGNVEQALVCLENAINYHDAEHETWHREAVLTLREIDHGDPEYAYYLDDVLPDEFEDDED